MNEEAFRIVVTTLGIVCWNEGKTLKETEQIIYTYLFNPVITLRMKKLGVNLTFRDIDNILDKVFS